MKKGNKGYLFLLNTIVLFSTFEVVSKTIAGKADPFQINFLRFFVGGLVLLLFALIKHEASVKRKDLLKLAGIGLINVVLSMNLLQLSLFMEGAKASVVAVIFSSNPIFVMLFAAIIEKEKITGNKICGMLLGITGIAVVFFQKLDFGMSSLLSPVLALLSSVFFGLFTVLGKRLSVNIGSLRMNGWSFLLGSLILLPFLWVFNIPVVKFDYSALPQIVYISVFITGVAYLTYFMGLTITGASSGSIVFFAKPVLASIFAVIFLREQLTLSLFSGTALIISGIAIVIYWDKIKKKFLH